MLVMKTPLRLAFAAAAGLLVSAVWAQAALAASPPDLTGVWNSADGASGRAGGSIIQPPPLKPEAKRRHDAFNQIVSPTGDTPGGVCLGAGMPALLSGGGGYPFEIIQRPEQITMIFELHGETRRIYFGDRNVPEKDRVPGRTGYSIDRRLHALAGKTSGQFDASLAGQ